MYIRWKKIFQSHPIDRTNVSIYKICIQTADDSTL